MTAQGEKRVLSIQSSVVFGYVGNKSATFPLQLHGYDVSTINSVQFSNHTGYGKWKGQVLNAEEAHDLFQGLRINNLLDFTHVLTGYIGSESFLKKVGEVVKELKSKNPNLIYVCDPVMGDDGKLYVSEALVPVYRTQILEQADIITPNQFELEQLTELPVETEEQAFIAMNKLHDRGVGIVVLSSSNLGVNSNMLCLASIRQEKVSKRYRLQIPVVNAKFVGTGDLFAASLLTWMDKEKDLKPALEKTVSVVQHVIKKTYERALKLAAPEETPTAAQMELQLISSKENIENPTVLFLAEEIEYKV
ncbi:pyridoxal kinase-like isoform X2 [Physella acuta]|uniref:pyridoxal kinase-like isoform X2 n=1 Tax=Physella acuta TaxID=109671 RepID=UPI0027DBC56C|nr:pyridoxal kinase-like isoform X2 [Physella acuta]